MLDTFFNYEILYSAVPSLARGFISTLLLGLLSIGIGLPTGLLTSVVRLYGPGPFRYLAWIYIDIFRAMPVLVLLILVYYALPFVGIRLSSWVSAVLTFSVVFAAYSAEVFRTGIESISRGQFEAAQSLGMPFLLTLRKVILPQAVRAVIPTITGYCVSMFKDTSLASTVALPELLKEANDAQSLYVNPSPLIGAALVYVMFLWPMVRLVGVLERQAATSNKR
ncbi:ABC transporter permease [Sinorhizobium sp. GW3]|nr:ABC transporter permease [Sinorhizobium sp. GW3]